MTLRSVQYDFQQCNMLHIALGNNVATGYNHQYLFYMLRAIHNNDMVTSPQQGQPLSNYQSELTTKIACKKGQGSQSIHFP